MIDEFGLVLPTYVMSILCCIFQLVDQYLILHEEHIIANQMSSAYPIIGSLDRSNLQPKATCKHLPQVMSYSYTMNFTFISCHLTLYSTVQNKKEADSKGLLTQQSSTK